MNKKSADYYPNLYQMRFPLLRALGDRILHQTRVGTYVEGGTVEIENRRLSEYESKVKNVLLQRLDSIEKNIIVKLQELSILETDHIDMDFENSIQKQSTRAVRIRKAQATRLNKESKERKERIGVLRGEIAAAYADAVAEVNTAQALIEVSTHSLNKGLAVWGKATRCLVLEKQLPQIHHTSNFENLLNTSTFDLVCKELGLSKPIN